MRISVLCLLVACTSSHADAIDSPPLMSPAEQRELVERVRALKLEHDQLQLERDFNAVLAHETYRVESLMLATRAATRVCIAPSELQLIGAWGGKCAGTCTLPLKDGTQYSPFSGSKGKSAR